MNRREKGVGQPKQAWIKGRVWRLAFLLVFPSFLLVEVSQAALPQACGKR